MSLRSQARVRQMLTTGQSVPFTMNFTTESAFCTFL